MFPVFFLTLLGLQLSAVVPAATRSNFARMMRIADVLHYEVPLLWNTSQQCGSISKKMPKHPEDTPSSSVTGRIFSEKLQDIFTKGRLFEFHIEEVVRNQMRLLSNPDCNADISRTVKNSLNNFLLTLKSVFNCLEMGDLIQPDPPEFPRRELFEDKHYGMVVMFRLQEWVGKVKQVLGDHVKHTHGC